MTPFEDVSAEPIGLPQPVVNDAVNARVPVEMLASEFLDALRVGRHPSIEDYVTRYPDYAEELRNLLPLVAAMEEWKADRQEEPVPRPLPQDFNIRQLGDCRIIREIGRGGMGVVFEGIQESVGRRVAVKLLPWRFGRDELWRQRFQREARLSASLRHANIVPVFRFGEYEGFCYYVMPLIVGMGLDWVIEHLKAGDGSVSAPQIEQARMGTGVSDTGADDVEPAERQFTAGSWKKIAKIGVQAAAALRYAHGRGLLHRDIKPGNLLLDTSGTVWITDFGLAQPIEQVSQTPSVAGTLRYMPPEQLEGQSDERSDIYALGLTLYELVTLQHAFDASSRSELMGKIRDGNVIPIREAAPDLPARLADILARAYAPDPADRYQSADEMTSALLGYLNRNPHRRSSGWLSRLFGGT